MNTGLGAPQTAKESEYFTWTRNLEMALEDLKGHLNVLYQRLEPIRLSSPNPDKVGPMAQPEVPASQLIDFIRIQTRKVQDANTILNCILNEIQI